jgi:type VI secretion system protein VasD
VRRLAPSVRGALRVAQAALAAALIGALASCKSAPPPEPPKPVTATLTIIGAADLNPNHEGRASPVYLRLYQLKDGSKFLTASFDDVTARSDQVLASALVAREERMVEPGATVTVNLEVPPETRLLGVVAEYADLADSQWRAASPEPAGGLLTLFADHSLLITVGRQAVAVTVGPPPKGAPKKQASRFSLPKLSLPSLSPPSAPAAPAVAAPAAPAVAAPAVAAPAAPAAPTAPAVAPPTVPAAPATGK